MIFHSHSPRPPLNRYIASIWLQQGYDPAHALERIMPDGCAAFIINLREDRFRLPGRDNDNETRTISGAILSGTRSKYAVLDTACQSSVMGVHFKPGGVFPFLAMPVSELHGEVLTLDLIWGSMANELRDQLVEAVLPGSKFRIMERFLLRTMRRAAEPHPAVAYALRQFQDAPGEHSIIGLSRSIGLSQRHFIQLFAEHVGMTPKKYCRVRRFQHVLKLIHSEREVNWAEIAIACDYFDQAHFNHDFRAFSGINPTAYLHNRSEHRNHVRLQE